MVTYAVLWIVLLSVKSNLATVCRSSNQSMAIAVEGMVCKESEFSIRETTERLSAALRLRGWTVEEHMYFQKRAAKLGTYIPTNELLLFGHTESEIRLIQACQTVAVDLPMKALIFQGANYAIYLAYNDPLWLARRHRIRSENATVFRLRSDLDNASGVAINRNAVILEPAFIEFELRRLALNRFSN